MRLKDLHELPKVRDCLSYLYVEHCRIDREDKAIAIHDAQGITPVPCASLSLLMLGPGTNISHAAVLTLADNGCLVAWCGEQGVRFYAAGYGRTRSAANLLRQAALCSHPEARLAVVEQMYRMRFPEELPRNLTLRQLRGREGVRVRDAYFHASRETGVEWSGRNYDRGSWSKADPVNRALSCANSCLYGVCHAAIIAAGYSPALGFVHTGKQLSFVYDIADLYKVNICVPLAFEAAKEATTNLERAVRLRCRDAFHQSRLLGRVVDDIERALDVPDDVANLPDFDGDPAQPGALWDPDVSGGVPGGQSYEADADKEE